MTTGLKSTLVMALNPASNISALRAEFPQPIFKIEFDFEGIAVTNKGAKSLKTKK